MEGTVWLSGEILTFLNKLLFPIVWCAAIGGVLVSVFVKTGRIVIADDFRFIAFFVVAATVFLGWMTMRLQRVGYRGRKLVVANYWREAEIPFEDVEAVESVWWYRGRMVRIRFRQRTAFGYTVYYLPKWGAVRAMWASPEEELQRVLSAEDS